MLDIVLHTGIEHPDLFWIVITGLAAFAAGFGLGRYRATVAEWLSPARTDRADYE